MTLHLCPKRSTFRSLWFFCSPIVRKVKKTRLLLFYTLTMRPPAWGSTFHEMHPVAYTKVWKNPKMWRVREGGCSEQGSTGSHFLDVCLLHLSKTQRPNFAFVRNWQTKQPSHCIASSSQPRKNLTNLLAPIILSYPSSGLAWPFPRGAAAADRWTMCVPTCRSATDRSP